MLRRIRYSKVVDNSLIRQLSSQKCGFKKIAVVGLGLMGHGIAQITAEAGYEVLAIEAQDKALFSGMKRINESLKKSLTKGKSSGTLTEAQVISQQNEIVSRIKTTTKIEDAHDCDLIIEAIEENMDVKLDFYRRLGPLIKPSAIFGSNTSSLPMTTMAMASGRPDRFVGLHYFNPVQVMKLLEIIRPHTTSDETFSQVEGFGKSIGKTTVTSKDTPGFIVSRLLIPYLIQAMAMVDRGDASVGDIDVSMQLGAGHPMGPLQLADFIGLDTTANIMNGWIKDHPLEPSFFMPLCLAEKMAKGELGRKSGQGFYTWNGDKPLEPV